MSTTGEILKNKFAALRPLLSARARRRGAAVEAQALGWGGVTRVAEATGRSARPFRRGWPNGRASSQPQRGSVLGAGGVVLGRDGSVWRTKRRGCCRTWRRWWRQRRE